MRKLEDELDAAFKSGADCYSLAEDESLDDDEFGTKKSPRTAQKEEQQKMADALFDSFSFAGVPTAPVPIIKKQLSSSGAKSDTEAFEKSLDESGVLQTQSAAATNRVKFDLLSTTIKEDSSLKVSFYHKYLVKNIYTFIKLLLNQLFLQKSIIFWIYF